MNAPRHRMRRTLLAATVGAAAAWTAGVRATESTPLRIIVPWPTGGAADSLGRLLATQLQEVSNRSVIVDNRGGANGIIVRWALPHARCGGALFGAGVPKSISRARLPKRRSPRRPSSMLSCSSAPGLGPQSYQWLFVNRRRRQFLGDFPRHRRCAGRAGSGDHR
jgi:hypothetical protein